MVSSLNTRTSLDLSWSCLDAFVIFDTQIPTFDSVSTIRRLSCSFVDIILYVELNQYSETGSRKLSNVRNNSSDQLCIICSTFL
jgi:hypothetical protein